ncbi:SHOCT domain-containing protein [Clostridium sp. YIM B02506]|uniref:SHOCT domain-containing protein n=1 Tax=Clostridium sp. YIM B02506 TaxID=2910680 RepID=UPI001EEDBBFD|nr:SHOCT domain-containing protein [Clostridium sp. YIM B02506]
MRKDIEDLIKSLKLPTFGMKKDYKCAEEYLEADERVLFIYPGNASINKSGNKLESNPLDIKNKIAGIFVITAKRVFHANNILGTHFEQIPISEVSSYRVSKMPLVSGVIQVISNNYIIEVDLSSKKQIVEAAKIAIEKALKNKNVIKLENQSNNTSIDIPEQIKKLADLRDVGILSEQEFTQKKKELLERM